MAIQFTETEHQSGKFTLNQRTNISVEV